MLVAGAEDGRRDGVGVDDVRVEVGCCVGLGELVRLGTGVAEPVAVGGQTGLGWGSTAGGCGEPRSPQPTTPASTMTPTAAVSSRRRAGSGVGVMSDHQSSRSMNV